MSRRVLEPPDDVTVYLVLNDHGKHGIAYDETDPAEADLERSTCARNCQRRPQPPQRRWSSARLAAAS
jgi:hypothetical protein